MIAPKFVATVQLPEDLSTTVQSIWGATVDAQPVLLPFGEGTNTNGFYALPSLNKPSSPSSTIVPPIVPPPTTVAPPLMPGPTLPAPNKGVAPIANARRVITTPSGQQVLAPVQAAPTADVKKPDNRTGVPVVGSLAAPLVAAPAVSVEPVAPVADLWSGLTGADKAPSLLDQVAPQRHSSGIPVGGLLFGSGLVALAGVAIVTGRRQLAHSRIVRR
jgi:hypothetical protein